MVNQELVNYIQAARNAGQTDEQIRTALSISGWQKKDVNEGLNLVSPINQSDFLQNSNVYHNQVENFQNESNAKKSLGKTIIVVSTLFLFVIIVGGSALGFYQWVKSKNADKQVATENNNQQPENANQAETQNPEIVFADKLNECTKDKVTFKHPITGDTLEKEILGVVDGKCSYVEQMPNNGKMECKYNESERKAMAQYYKDTVSADSIGISVNADSDKTSVKYTINGKEADNPLQEMMDGGVCIISGYQ